MQTNDASLTVVGIAATSATDAYVIASSWNVESGIWKTTNGGVTWVKQSANYGPTSFPNIVYFFDSNNGIILGDPVDGTNGGPFEIYKTNNGGTTWTAVTSLIADVGEWGLTSLRNFCGIPTVDGYGKLIFTSNTKVYYTSNFGTSFLNVTTHPSNSTNSPTITNISGTNATYFDLTSRLSTGVINNGDGNPISQYIGYNPSNYAYITFIPGTLNRIYQVRNGSSYECFYKDENDAIATSIDTDSRNIPRFYNSTTGFAQGSGTTIWKFNPQFLTAPTNTNAVKFTLYPNPVKNILQIEGAIVKNTTIMDLSGKIVATANSNTIDIQDLKTGIYFVKIIDENGISSTQKIIKE